MMWSAIEIFSRSHEHTIQALGVLGTFAAVVVSLGVALLGFSRSRTRLSAIVRKIQIIHGDVPYHERPRYVVVDVVNTGDHPLRLPYAFFHWRLLFSSETGMVNPLDWFGTDPYFPKRAYPFEIAPRASAQIALSELEAFRSEMNEQRKRTKWLRSFRFLHQTAHVLTDDGRIFRAKISRDIREEFRGIVKSHAS